MGALIAQLDAACKEELTKITNSVYGEMVGIVSGRPYATGEAAGAIGIEMGAMSSFVGGTHPHLYWLNCGNGSGRIYPKNGKALYLQDFGIWRSSVRTYPGIDFVTTIASHY